MKLLLNHLYIVSTPIGNLDDITLRAIEVLKSSGIILCEDTRRTIKLLNHFKIKKKLISYHKFNEKKQLTSIIQHFNEGKILSLVSDAGTPLLSDPGRLLVNICLENSIEVRYVLFSRNGEEVEAYKQLVFAYCSENKLESIERLFAGDILDDVDSCVNPLNENYKYASLLSVEGTPTIFLEDGRIIPGYQNSENILAFINN